MWGVFPLYFKSLADVQAVEVLGHRIVWSALLTTLLVLALGRAGALAAVFRDRKRLAGLAGSAIAITVNWGCYIWAVGNGHALDASIGYFLHPLASLLLGTVFLKERLDRRQGVAVGLVCIGIAVLAAGLGHLPWVAVTLAISFGFYGLLRKVVPVDALVGLTVETLLLLPFALAYVWTRPHGGALLSGGLTTQVLLLASGPVTTIPLVLFAFGARRLKLATLGLMQYVNPTMQMSIAVLVLGEAFTIVHAVTFAFIWSGLLLYSLPFLRRRAT
jgi:chloramphenicol-sensitive protein RarD